MIHMKKKIIWSTHKDYIFVDILKKEFLIEGDLSSEEVELLLLKYNKENIIFLREQIEKKFTKRTSNEVLAFATSRSKDGVRNQFALELGNSSNNIFKLDFDRATWYIDTWNIKADIEYEGEMYYYTFRLMRDESKKYEMLDRINKNRKMLTNTYLGHHTKTILNKRS